ncbi:MAG: NADH-quinone oxidoreductase subunit L, partial [Myxococcales bacterium]|nr:NADH-quinone oxidoreductase subunit L [Myxococcales bacterium]
MLDAIREYTWLMPLLPLLGAIFNRFVGGRLGERAAGWIASASLFAAFIHALLTFLSLKALPPEARHWTNTLIPWIHVGDLQVNVAYLVDPLSSVMTLVITGIGTLIHVYSIGYMEGEPCYDRYYGYLSLFCFAMLNLVLADNLLLLFLGWEGVGVCSYWLIGFWFTDLQKAAAGFKAFLVNRIGDMGFLLGIFVLYWHYAGAGHPTLEFSGLAEHVGVLKGATFPNGMFVATVVGLLLFVGATGKSAQIPLYIWLPDAMVGPTPVSALIHAATMVTA